MTKKEQYTTLISQIESLIEGQKDETSVLANVSAALKETFPQRFFWVGFYLVRGEKLHLGPFQGSTACYTIGHGKGVCGTAWQERRTLIVDDVEQFAGHIACSSLSRSEIVTPIFAADNSVKGVIDVDSKDLAAFDNDDRDGLEAIAQLLCNNLYT